MARLRSLIILAPVFLAACEDQGPRTPAKIVITPNEPRVPMGGTRQLTAAVLGGDGRVLEDERVTFESAEPDVVTVSEAGLLTSIGSLDTVTITASSGGLATELEALVVPPPSSLVVVPRSLRLAAGEFAQLYIVVTDENGDSIPAPDLVMEIDVPSVVSASLDGAVVAGRSGLATIFVISGEHRVDIPVTVTP